MDREGFYSRLELVEAQRMRRDLIPESVEEYLQREELWRNRDQFEGYGAGASKTRGRFMGQKLGIMKVNPEQEGLELVEERE